MTRIFRSNPLQVRGVLDALPFRDLEDDGIQRETVKGGCLQGAPDAGRRAVNGTGHEVHRKLGASFRNPEPGGQFDGLHAAGLVKGIAVFLVDHTEHLSRGETADAAHERLIGEDGSSLGIDNRLKRHRELEPQPTSFSAGDTPVRRFAMNLQHRWNPDLGSFSLSLQALNAADARKTSQRFGCVSATFVSSRGVADIRSASRCVSSTALKLQERYDQHPGTRSP